VGLNIEKIDEVFIKSLIGLPLSTTFQKAFLLEEELLPKATSIYRQHYNDIAIETISLFKNVKDTLFKLQKRGIKLAVASSKGKVSLIKILKKHNIYDIFSFVGGEENVKNKKPAPDIVNLILNNTNVSPDNCIVVGDTVFDIEMGQRANTLTCGVTYGNNTKNELQSLNPNFMIDDMSEILNLI
jgi:phosphoglycolate phosphatase